MSVFPAFAAGRAGHGNDRVWKAWKAMKPASHPSHTLWKSLRIPTFPRPLRLGSCLLITPSTRNHRRRKGLVTDVSGPQRNACPGPLIPQKGLVTTSCALRAHIHGALRGVPAGLGSRKTRPVASRRRQLELGQGHSPYPAKVSRIE
jgi:hypothetical protein